MRTFLLGILLICFLSVPVEAASIEAPAAPDSEIMPDNTQDFEQGLLEMLDKLRRQLHPDLLEASKSALAIIAAALMVSILGGASNTIKASVNLASAVTVTATLFLGTQSMVRLGADTIADLSEYGKLLLPVMAAAMAAQGGFTGAAALYTGTAFFDAVLCSIFSKVLIPAVYLFLVIASADSVTGDHRLKKLKELVKKGSTWFLKTAMTIYISYMGISGVVVSSADAAALKTTKTAISTAVPVVGGILSAASEAVLATIEIAKNAAGVYGILALLAICLGPFLKTGVHFLLLKLTASICGILDAKGTAELVEDYSGAMGMILGMTGSVCLLQMISTMCFMKGMGS